jgi:DNA repair exonuclease SbcCD ATPase subunit
MDDQNLIQKLDTIENYLKYITEKENSNNILLNDLSGVVSSQGAHIYNMIQIMNLQNQAINEIHQKINSIVSATRDIDIREHMVEETLGEVSQGLQTVVQEIDNVKQQIDTIKVYNLPDGYFK